MAVVIVGTLDTKGVEIGFVRDRLRSAGLETLVVDAGSLGEPAFAPDVPRDEVFRAVGSSAEEVRRANDRGNAVTLAARGAAEVVRRLYQDGKVQGVFGLGGSAGTTIGSTAMRALPYGVPKLLVSTLASGQVQPYVGVRDICMMHGVTALSGPNRLSGEDPANAA